MESTLPEITWRVSKEELKIVAKEEEVKEKMNAEKVTKKACYKSLNFGNNYWYLGFLLSNNAVITF